MNWLALILGGEIGALPTTYLGLPLGAKSKSIDIWNNVIEKCEKKLASMEGLVFSLGNTIRGSPTLINSIRDALPTYMMSFFPLHGGVIKMLDSIGRKFLW